MPIPQTPSPVIPRLAYTIAEACQTGLFKKSRCYELIEQGVIPARMSGGKMVIMVADLERYAANLPSVPVRPKS